MKVLQRIAVLFLCVVVSGFGQTNENAFFRISSPSNVVISGFDPVAGTLTCSNAVAGTTNQLQRSYDLSETTNWVDFVQLASSALVVTETIMDLDPPEGMAFIPGGVFQMGDTFGEGDSDEFPVHSVYVSGFYMDKYEVTKALWDEVYNWATNHGYGFYFNNSGSGKATNHPVHTVNWSDCVIWCNARSEMEGRTPCYNPNDGSCDWNANGYRLPTEAEWEKAARGGLNGMRFSWGNFIAHSNANYVSTGDEVYDVSPTHGYHPLYMDGTTPYSSPVGSFAPNGYGLHDMAGNMMEWCWDWHDEEYYASSPSSDPRGALPSANRATRGGNWDYDEGNCRSADRIRSRPTWAYDYVGFRVCRSAE